MPFPDKLENPEFAQPHRDDHHLLIFGFEGELHYTLDFEESLLQAPFILHIDAGKIHQINELKNAKGWILAIESFILEEEFLYFLQSFSSVFLKTSDAINLYQSILGLSFEIQSNTQNVFIEKALLFQINSLFCLIINEVASQKNGLSKKEKRAYIIFHHFLKLLKTNYKAWKKPSDYSKELHITTSHLNDTIKSISGLSATATIHQYLILEAKRLLYFSDLEIREIAYCLGFDDVVYFGKLFKKQCKLSPLQFRKQFRD